MHVLAGNSNLQLANEIAKYLGTGLTPVEKKKFANGENYVKINESVRGHDVFIIQSICEPVNDNLMELLLMIDAAKRASAKSISVVIPHYGYARQDRKAEPREPISAKLVANMIEQAGADRVLTVDIHSRQQQGFFDIPLDDLWAAPVFQDYFESKNLSNLVIVSPDSGGVARARHLGKLLDAPIAVIDKRRSKHNESEVMHVLGDVEGKDAIIMDDMIDTGGTISTAAKAISEKGADKVYICATHGILSGPAVERLRNCPAEEVVLTNTIPINTNGKIKVASVAPLLGEAIHNIYNRESVSALARANISTNLVVQKDDQKVTKEL